VETYDRELDDIFAMQDASAWAGLARAYAAEAVYRRALEFAPHDTVVLRTAAAPARNAGRLEEAIDLLRRAVAALRELRDRFAEEGAYQFAMAHAVRGERDEAFAWLEGALEQRDAGLAEAKPDILLRSLRQDARWPEFLARIGQIP